MSAHAEATPSFSASPTGQTAGETFLRSERESRQMQLTTRDYKYLMIRALTHRLNTAFDVSSQEEFNPWPTFRICQIFLHRPSSECFKCLRLEAEGEPETKN
ncbi:hypothetical protein CHARACLAT_027435 [Characodon lateralis]|uniref:Uncharacterized protein n=1 Tax=Characodon lateralis TaxID=208331 RepID=A0ABU7F7K1_9TELE|nr:hypothetical protein [Characodon lateralis]